MSTSAMLTKSQVPLRTAIVGKVQHQRRVPPPQSRHVISVYSRVSHATVAIHVVSIVVCIRCPLR
jgi:hypothetical protein